MHNLLVACSMFFLCVQACAADAPDAGDCDAMTAARLGELIQRIDADATHSGNTWEFGLESFVVAVIYDEAADRMRILIPIKSTADIEQGELLRVM